MESSINALLIGCGNIGAQYDLYDTDKVWTHAKAFAINERIQFSVYDTDKDKAALVSKVYGVPVVDGLTDEEISKYQVVSITSPTPTHFPILNQLIKAGTPVIICEKPVSTEAKELALLIDMYQQSRSKILVNYIRRFQPAYTQLKKSLNTWDDGSGFKHIIIKYQRGFLNNASHAIDLLEYLFDSPIGLQDFKLINGRYDAFTYDATISGGAAFLNKPLLFAGVSEAEYAIFEIELFFATSKIVICHSGNDIRFYKKTDAEHLIENSTLRVENILNQYMMPVVSKALLLLDGDEEDNFLSSIAMNLRLLGAAANIIN